MQRRTEKIYNKSRLIVTVKCLLRSKGIQTSWMLQPLISVSGHLIFKISILNMYETAVTYMISVNIKDTVQHSDITFDHNNVFTSRIMPTFLLMVGACIYLIPYATIVLKLHGSCSSV